MKDSILKGTGNSRFLKSAVPAGTSWADALAMLQAGTFPIDFNGINTEGFQQVGTPLNKANLLKDATALTLGLTGDATPNDMFNVLAHAGDLHVWRKTVTTAQEIPAGYTLGDAQSIRLVLFAASSGVTVRYADSISVNDGGAASLKNSSEISLQSSSAVNTLNSNCKGKFVEFSATGMNKVSVSGIVYIQANSVFSEPDNYIYASNAQLVNAYPLTPAGTTVTYPVSTNRNAYQEGSDAKPAGYTLEDVVTGTFRATRDTNSTGALYSYGDGINVSEDGTISGLVNPSSMYVRASNSNILAEVEKLKGKFISVQSYGIAGIVFTDGIIYYIPKDAVFTRIDNYSELTIDRYQPVTGYPAIPANTTIEYLGCLGEKTRMQVVSYVGTGTYGSKHPTTVTFDIVPKIVFIAENVNYQPKIMTIVPSTLGAFGAYSSGGSVYGLISPDVTITGKRISFFSATSSGYQMNDTGNKYFAIAIG